ncbi:GRB2-associated-binding protein 2 [Sciurus carolinensis]|uniref:GRB2-associated-binding protein 2 n=1 Tax=Sciurus carolinensis TaxID=30640 RepID=A0AA41T089_SCICA|nr:GRB2-associated-binding protein 2 [Sciurus carolinensis]
MYCVMICSNACLQLEALKHKGKPWVQPHRSVTCWRKQQTQYKQHQNLHKNKAVKVEWCLHKVWRKSCMASVSQYCGSGSELWTLGSVLCTLVSVAWRKRWFILWSTQCSGDPGVLEYYKHDQSKKPLWIINLDLCEQVQANVTFHKKGLPCGFLFNIKTNKCTFYLVAETKEYMYKWVQSICQICRFQQEVESTGPKTPAFSGC